MSLPLFDVPPPSPQPIATAEERPTDILRRVEHKYGPFVTLRCMTEAERLDSKTDHRSLITWHYTLIEFRDGRVFEESETGGRPSNITPARIDAEIRSGLWREVRQ